MQQGPLSRSTVPNLESRALDLIPEQFLMAQSFLRLRAHPRVVCQEAFERRDRLVYCRRLNNFQYCGSMFLIHQYHIPQKDLNMILVITS